MKSLLIALFGFLISSFELPGAAKLNILLITADDLGYEVMPFLGGAPKDITPNLSKLATQGMSFHNAHVNIAICAPSRSIIATGRYGFNSGCFGFNKLPKDIPTVFGTFQKNGYLTGILGKVPHSTPDIKFKWDFAHDYAELNAGRSPKKYHDYTMEFLERCKKENKPFYFMVNSHDPHRPFHNPKTAKESWGTPSKLYSPDEVTVPSYLTDLPEVREELSHYYNSVRRLDDTVGRVLGALEKSGLAENTLVMFLTDNGSAFPFAKANTYLASTKTPLLVRWPNIIKAGSVDKNHFVANVDFFATFMEATGLPQPKGLDGQSLVPLFKGHEQKGRDFVFTQIDYTIGGPAKPMRCIQDKNFGYIFNAFSDGQFAYKNNNEGLTFKAMQAKGKTDPKIQARVDMFRHRVPQEFYDLQADPGCTMNLINSPEHAKLITSFQNRLRAWMVKTGDHNIKAFDVRDNPAKLAQAVKDYPKMIKPEQQGKNDTKPTTSDADRKARRKAKREAAKKGGQ